MDKILKPPVPPVTSNICEMATEDIPCGVLKEERSKAIDKHLAATLLQAHWRGTWVRKCLQVNVNVTPEVLKILQDSIFGNHETLSALMNEFFILYPGTKYAYSVASALSGVLGLHQHHGVSTVSRTCKWIPYFQGVFYCHANCKVHFDVNSTLPHSTVKVYNNDTGMKLPQAYNAHKTFDVEPNIHGYTVMGHGSLKEPPGIGFEVHWQLTILSSTEGAFHICDNEEYCKELPLSSASKLHIDEIFIPNRRNILGGIQLSVTRHEAISFRAAATSPDLEIVAKLRTTSSDGKVVELSSCSGVGELFWPYIRLVPLAGGEHSNIKLGQSLSSAISSRSTSRPNKNKPPTTGKNIKSATKLKSYREPKQYSIEVVAPSGWPLTLAQWKRVDEARNLHETIKIDNSKKAALKEKTPTSKASARERSEKEKVISNSVIQIYPINPGDAYVELECSLTSGRGIVAQRDDDREMEFTAARKAWDQNEPGRNRRGAEIRKEFREEFLETPAPPASDTTVEPMMNDFEGEHNVEEYNMKEEHPVQGPTPVSDSGMLETSLASEEEAKYLLMPDQLRDKFKPLHFVPMCTKELLEDGCTVLSPGMAEAGIIERQARKHAAIARKNELQAYNENVVLGLQKKRSLLLGKLFVDSILPPEISQVLEERIEAIAQETMARTLSAAKKKQDSKPSKK